MIEPVSEKAEILSPEYTLDKALCPEPVAMMENLRRRAVLETSRKNSDQ